MRAVARPARTQTLRRLAWTIAGLCVVAGASAQPQAQIATATTTTASPAARPDRIFTRARLTSTFDEGRDKSYVRLKLLPKAKIPFQVQTFRLKHRALVADIPVGAEVEFLAEPIDGTNTVTAIRPVSECKRFEVC